jgi:adenylate cyclase
METIGAPDTAADTSPEQQSQPSIAVLPFTNMSGDPEQEYFSDGLTEDIITDLSRISRLSVSARNTTFVFKGKPVNVQEVGKQLGVRFMLEGSLQKSVNRVRITAQLIDTATGHHVWAERYDRELEDFFIVQDEITHSVVTALDVVLIEGEQARIWRKSTRNVTAYNLFLRGRQTWYSTMDRLGCAQGRRLYEEAIAADENFARAYVALAWILLHEYQYGWCSIPEETLEKALELTCHWIPTRFTPTPFTVFISC